MGKRNTKHQATQVKTIEREMENEEELNLADADGSSSANEDQQVGKLHLPEDRGRIEEL